MSIPNVCGIKLTVPNYYLFEQIRRALPEINLLNGPDESVSAGLIAGADGAIGSTYNLLPSVASDIYNAFTESDIALVKEKQHLLNAAIDTILSVPYKTAWKEPLRYIDIDPGYTVFPAHTVTEEDMARFEKILTENGALAKMREMM
jgi:dihydrodipicolinate synthase/N-acetylneuraminate lyase